MYGYIIAFEGLPKAVWACETNLKDYNWKNRHSENMLEISLVKAEEITIILDGVKKTYKDAEYITCTVGCDPKESFSNSKTNVKIISVAVEFPRLKIAKRYLIPGDKPADNIFLPAIFKADNEELNEISLDLYKYIKLISENSVENSLLSAALFFEIISKISGFSKNRIYGRNDDIKNYYVKKINYILERDFKGKITEESVAKEVGISSVYLSALYKEVTGISFSQSLLFIRMKKAGELLLNPNISASKVANLCGYSDESYFRKKFKKYYGMGIKEYRLIKSGITLYHDKPQRENVKSK